MGTVPSLQLREIGQIAMPARDIGRAVRFYRDTLGLPFLFEAPPGLAFFDCAGVRLMLAAPEPGSEATTSAAPSDSGMVLYYRVPDIQAAFETLTAAKVVFPSPPHRIARMPDHDLWLAFFRDSEDNLVALMSEVRPPAPHQEAR